MKAPRSSANAACGPPAEASGAPSPAPHLDSHPGRGAPHLAEFAIKVYKTSVLTFKDRDRYVSGEFRWRHGYCRSNPRKMVRMWAEKEMRNYRRLALAGVPCPSVHLLREHADKPTTPDAVQTSLLAQLEGGAGLGAGL